MAQTPSQKATTGKYRQKNGRKQVNLELTSEDRDRWQTYADRQGLSLTAMVRDCVRRCMEGQATVPASRTPVSQGIEGMEGMD